MYLIVIYKAGHELKYGHSEMAVSTTLKQWRNLKCLKSRFMRRQKVKSKILIKFEGAKDSDMYYRVQKLFCVFYFLNSKS